MSELILTPDEAESMKALVREVGGTFGSAEAPEFLQEAYVLSHELPLQVRRTLLHFRLYEPDDAICVIRGYPVDDAKIGPTPGHWRQKDSAGPSREEEILLVLLGSLLGDVIGWGTQQDGRIVHDILPIAGHEKEQLGSGSEELLTWHVEDAFHPYRGDYLGMMCMRNPDRVATTFAPVSRVRLTDQQRQVLSLPYFTIRPDESHLPKNRGQDGDLDPWLNRAYAQIEQMVNSPEKIAVLSGDPRQPYARLDPYFMDPVQESEAQEALREFISAVDTVLEDQVLAPGEICFIDNFQAVHGRKPFRARFDGTDRWLKRINVARDLRRSRSMRKSAECRVIG